MANSSTPFGFRSFGHRDGSAPTMGLERVSISASNTNLFFTGDLVATSSAGAGRITSIISSTAAVLPRGVFAGCEYYNPNVGRVVWSAWWPGSVGTDATTGPATAYLISDPEMQFVAQFQSSIAVTAAAVVGTNVTFVTSQSSLGNQTTGISAMALSTVVSTGASQSSYPWAVVDMYSNFAPPGVTDDSSGYNLVVVTPNSWQRRAGTVGALST